MAVKDILARKSVNKTEIVEYQSSFDFEEFEITDKKTIAELYNKEEKVLQNINKIQRATFEFFQALYEAQNLLSKAKTGAFVAWFENLGLKKDSVYRAIDKYKLYLDTNNDKVFELSHSVVKGLRKEIEHRGELENLNDEFISEIVEVVEAEKPVEKLKEIIDKETDQEIDIDKEISKIDKQVQKYYEKITELENKKDELIKKR